MIELDKTVVYDLTKLSIEQRKEYIKFKIESYD